MSGDPPTGNVPLLDEDSAKYPGNFRRQMSGEEMERAAFISQHSVKGFLQRNLFVLLTISAVALGVILGFATRPGKLSPREIKYLTFPGELLMRMLQMLVLPLIISSLVTGISALDNRASGKMGTRAVIYYMLTTLIAVFIGICIVTIIKPGKGSRDIPAGDERNIEPVPPADTFLDLIRNMIPRNLVEACFKQYKTVYKKTVPTRNGTIALNLTDSLNLTESKQNLSRTPHATQETAEELLPVPSSSAGVNALGLVVFSMCLGLVIGNMRQRGQALQDFFDCLYEAIMRMVAVIIWYTPVGILFLIAGRILEMKNWAEMGGQLGMYTLSVMVGLIIHSLVVLPLLFFMVTKKNPYNFIGGLLQALITALGTSSSSSTLPITFRCLEENIGVDKQVTRFVLPVGATVNMAGTALYEVVAAIFIAQVNDMELNFGHILTIRDRLRTATNVLGDSIGAGIVGHLSRQELQTQECDPESSVIEEEEKSYHLIHLENDEVSYQSSETTM
ncbi:excitatory amino acid transporter 4 isoform X2 [Takifugu rubripes]|uniref:excitatory amino acid transporter 4 isoform X2 n=1 Tax=Takifugu rubripes TaxID=31033 RepID=UPI001145E888|nr:excitatory amino acid transporter 1-like isoform X2 [Takifugu rubripes]